MAKPTPAVSLSDFEAAERKPGSKCWYRTKLTDELRALVNDANAAGHSGAAISRVLQDKLHIDVTQSAVRHHFLGECSCPKK